MDKTSWQGFLGIQIGFIALGFVSCVLPPYDGWDSALRLIIQSTRIGHMLISMLMIYLIIAWTYLTLRDNKKMKSEKNHFFKCREKCLL